MRAPSASTAGARSATGVVSGAKRKSTDTFAPCSPVFAMSAGSSLQSRNGVVRGFRTGSSPSPLQSSSQNTNVRAPSAATWTSKGWKMRPSRFRHAGSGRKARAKNCPSARPFSLIPCPSSSEKARARPVACATVTPDAKARRTWTSRVRARSLSAAIRCAAFVTASVTTTSSTWGRPSHVAVTSKRSPGAHVRAAPKRP